MRGQATPGPPDAAATPFAPGADAVPAAALTGAATFTAADAERVRLMTAMDIFREANAKRATFLATGAVLRQRGRLASAAPAGPSGRHLNPLAETEAPGKAAGPAGTGPRLAPVVPTWPPFKLAGLAFGLLCAVGVGQIPLSDEHPKAGTMLGVVLIVSWWIAEVAPLGITALLPIVLFGPCGVGLSTKAVAATYFNHITFLLLGAFLVDLAIENSNLHKRFALSIIVRFGSSARVLLAAFMVVAWVMSMFCLNTSTTMMLVPFALGVIENAEALVAGEGPSHRAAAQKFGVGLLVGIAWASNVGGLGTLIGTAPNGVLVGVFNDLFPTAAVDLNFATWMSWGLPLSVLLLLPAYAVVFFTYIYYGGAESLLKFDATVMQKALAQLGPMSFDEKVVAFVQALQIVLWIVRGALIETHWGTCSVGGIATKHACKAANGKWTSPVAGWDAGIACGAALLLFFIPSRTRPGKRVLEWDDCPTRLPWGQLFLFGGGFAIAAGFAKSGLSAGDRPGPPKPERRHAVRGHPGGRRLHHVHDGVHEQHGHHEHHVAHPGGRGRRRRDQPADVHAAGRLGRVAGIHVSHRDPARRDRVRHRTAVVHGDVPAGLLHERHRHPHDGRHHLRPRAADPHGEREVDRAAGVGGPPAPGRVRVPGGGKGTGGQRGRVRGGGDCVLKERTFYMPTPFGARVPGNGPGVRCVPRGWMLDGCWMNAGWMLDGCWMGAGPPPLSHRLGNGGLSGISGIRGISLVPSLLASL